MAWILLNLRRLRDERATAVGFALLVLVTTGLAAGAPRAFDRLGDETLRAELATRTPAERNIQLIELDRLPAGQAAPLDTVQAEADAINETVPREIRDRFARRDLLVESIRYTVEKPTNDPTTVRLRIQPAAADRIHLVAGRLPTGAFTSSAEGVVTLEVAISTTNATTIGVAIGDTIPLQTDGSDTLAASRDLGPLNALVVGTFTVDRPDDPAWLGDSSLDHATVRTLGGDTRLLDTSALLAPEAYQVLLSATEEPASFLRYTFQDYIDPAALRQRDTATLIAAFRRLETRYPTAVPRGGAAPALRTSIRPFLESETRRWTSATALLTVAVVGPAAVGAAALGMLAVLAARRRRAALSLSRGRGASVTQVTLASIAEGLVLAAPAAAIGAAIGSQVAPSDPLLLPAITGAVVAVVAIALLTLATVPATGGPAFGSGRDVSAPRPPTPRRLVLEGLVVLLAAAGASALRERGLRPDGSADPLIAAVPALVGVAAGLVALRAIPYPTRLLARIARLRRGLVGVLAMRRASSGGGAPVLLVLLATTTIGAFSATAVAYLDRSADAAGWQDVGADVRVTASQDYLQRDYDFAALPGVEAAAKMFTGSAAVVGHGATPDLIVLDVEGYDDVTRGTQAELHLPVDLYGPAGEPVPVVIGAELVDRPGGMKLGETATTSIQGYTFQAKVIAVIDAFPGAPSGSFMIASEKQLRALFPDAPLRPTSAYLKAPAADVAALRSTITSVMPQAIVTGRAERTAMLSDAPVVRAVRLGIAATAVVAAIYAALAVAAALALGGAARTVETAHLRTLGMNGRQTLVALILEQGPALAFAFIGGLALGVGLLAFLAPGLQLQRLVGVTVDVSVGLDPVLILAMALGIAGVALIGIGVGLWLGRRLAPIAALRRGFE